MRYLSGQGTRLSGTRGGRRAGNAAMERNLEINHAIAELGRSIISSRSIHDISALILQEAKRLTQSRYGCIGYIDPVTNYLVCPVVSRELCRTSQTLNAQFIIDECGCLGDRVLEKRKPVLSNNIENDARAITRKRNLLPVHRYLSAPVIINGDLVGQIAVADSVHKYTTYDLNAVEQLAVLYAMVIHWERSERKYREIFDAVNDAIVIHDKDCGLPEDVNYKACEMLGYSLDELKKLTVGDWSSNVPPYTEENAQALMRNLKSGESLIFDWQVKDRSGRLIWIEVNLKKVMLGGKEQIIAAVREITERKVAQEKLRESEEKYKTLFEASRDAIVLLTPDNRFIDGNPSALRIFGCANKEEFTSKTLFDFMPEYQANGDRSLDMVRRIKAILEEKHSHSFELIQKRADGKEFLAAVLLNNMIIGGQQLQQATLRDITERKRIEKALQESEQRFRCVFSESPIGILVYGFDGELIDENRAARELFPACNQGKLKHKNLFDTFFLPEAEREKLRSHVPVSCEASFWQAEIDGENSQAAREGGRRHLQVIITPMPCSQERPWEFLVQVQDFTQKRNAEERIRALSRKIIESQERQRRQISRELHDGVAQDLSTLKMNLKTIASHPSIVINNLNEDLLAMSKVIDGAITGVRDLAYFLHPPGLDQLGLVRAISEYCEDFAEKTGVGVEFFSIGLEKCRFPFQIEINLFRIVQEALNNVRKHAGAAHVTIRLAASYPKIILRINDDGRGFDVQRRLEESLRCKHMGIQGMLERVGIIEGKMRIYSGPMKGTKIVVEVPYHEREGKAEDEDSNHR